MSKVLAYIPLHYGKEYLHAAIKSVDSFADKIIILYSAQPSFGTFSGLPCPDSAVEMYDIAMAASSQIEWVDIVAGQEGTHRDMIFDYADGFDIILPIDADEVWDQQSLEDNLIKVESMPQARFGIVGFITFWKSFNHVCRDQFAPVRIIKTTGEGEIAINGTIYHFGYAQDQAIMDYKWSIHGHQDELRPGWQDIFLNWTDELDVHPVAKNIWNPEPFDKTTLPDFLKEHPNYGV